MSYDYDYEIQKTSSNFIYKVYAWMAGALALTAGTAAFVSNTSLMKTLFSNTGLLFVLLLLQIGLVFFLGFFIQKMSLPVASFAFTLYSMLTGVVFSSLFVVYTHQSLAATFGITASMFAVMAIYGYFTEADLSELGNILFMALIGLIISSLVNLFLQSSTFNYIISAIGVLIFSGLTAYDMQKIRLMSEQLLDEGNMRSKVAILCALTLYLDFINLFLMLLQFTGQKRQD